MNSLNESSFRITEAFQALQVYWISSGAVWNDRVREEFENATWIEFESTTTASVQKLQNLSDTIAQAEREIP